MAAISNIINVTSCSASHTNWRNVFGFLGGIKFFPNTAALLSISAGFPLKPKYLKKEIIFRTVCSHVHITQWPHTHKKLWLYSPMKTLSASETWNAPFCFVIQHPHIFHVFQEDGWIPNTCDFPSTTESINLSIFWVIQSTELLI